MAEIFPYYFEKLWQGLKNVPFFDFGFSFASFFIGLIMISAAMWLLSTFFGIRGIDTMTARAGKNYRKKAPQRKEQKQLLKDIHKRYKEATR